MIMRKLTPFAVGPVLVALAAAAGGAGLTKVFSGLETGVFMGGSAKLAGLVSGVAAVRAEEGWIMPFAGQPLMVTTACSATDFFLMTAALLGWHFAQRVRRPALLPLAAAGALVAAVPVTLCVNALRIVAVAQAHRWVIPRMPAAYDSFLHMLTGVAVFLPALIALNLLLELHGRTHTPPARD